MAKFDSPAQRAGNGYNFIASPERALRDNRIVYPTRCVGLLNYALSEPKVWLQSCVNRYNAMKAFLLLLILFSISISAKTNPHPSSYDIKFDIDFENKKFVGNERVRWVNKSDEDVLAVYFHLYPNMRVALQKGKEVSPLSSDEPFLSVDEVRTGDEKQTLLYSLEEQGTLLRVNFQTPVQKGSAADIFIAFRGTVPEVDSEQTGIIAHVFQQVDAVLRSQKETRRARDVNFFCRNVLMLGVAYPILSVRDGNDWQRKADVNIGDTIFSEIADYNVTITTQKDVRIFTSGEEAFKNAGENKITYEFKGENLRNFAIIGGKTLVVKERNVAGVNVRSVYKPERETIGLRVLDIAANAIKIYQSRFGALPYKQVNVVETPLVAGIGCVEFSGLSAIATALYVDFDSPAMASLPELIREQRESVEDSLEWTVAHAVAQQWWGNVIGNNPQTEPVLDEALSNWSALLYYREVYGEAKANQALEDQLRGVYKVYRTFGGEDIEANRETKNYKNFFQYAAIVGSKGALMFSELRRLLGEAKFFASIKSFYQNNKFKIVKLDDLKDAFKEQSGIAQQQMAISRTFNRWLNTKRGDKDIAPPDPKLADSLGIAPKKKDKGNSFARLGKFFWRQMTRIR